ncbi:MAG: class I SAM-dependent methyltransferase [Chloroflexi bacterium]|nr:class I SAM-dependent methyltransferase [Chloroflexota bacterium]
MEYRLAIDPLGPLDGCRVLDVGSPKLPVLVLARHARCELVATDIRDYFVGSTSHFLTCIGLGSRLGKDIHLEAQDARHFSYPDGSFDRVFSVSVLEHIPDDGDAEAMREIARILRPAGIVTLTVPFSASGYREQFKRGDVYERQGQAGPIFYQRFYDVASLHARLVEPSGLTLLDTTYFGERAVKFERYWNRIPIKWKVPLLWAQPFLAALFLKRLPAGHRDHACGVALTLTKRPVTEASSPT